MARSMCTTAGVLICMEAVCGEVERGEVSMRERKKYSGGAEGEGETKRGREGACQEMHGRWERGGLKARGGWRSSE